MNANASFLFESETRELLFDIYQSLLPETHESISDRSVISLSLEDVGLVLKIESKDIISLRSAVNTWLRLVQTAYDVVFSSY